MSTPILATKLYLPSPRPTVIRRPRLLERLGAGLSRNLTLLSAPAGFGKTTLLSDWLVAFPRPVAWLSLDEGDTDPARLLTYLVAAVQTVTVASSCGAGVLGLLASPQPLPMEALLTTLVNDFASLPERLVLVLDDYHRSATPAVDQVLTFLLEHLPPRLHVVLATREDPQLPLARLRVRGELSELRVADLRFTAEEAGAFLTQAMGLHLAADDLAALEQRTEGWIAGLQLAGLSLQRQPDATRFIHTFSGSHHFVLDYLAEEVLQQQPEHIQQFLLRTSILERLCGPLCDAVLGTPAGSGQATLEYLERANLFLVPLDDERRWYRYHQLFADLLRQRLQQTNASSTGGEGAAGVGVAELHRRASIWYEEQGLELEAFVQAAAAQDVERAARLLEGKGMPLHFRGAVVPVLTWLESLPTAVLDARPALWVMYASALSMTNNLTGVEQKLQAAEAALQGAEPNETTRNLIGHIAAIRALLAATQYQVEAIIAQSHRALEYLHPDNLPVRTATIWKLGWAHLLQGDRVAAGQALTEAVSLSKVSGNTIIYLSALVALGVVQEAENQLFLAAQSYRQALQQAGAMPQPGASEAHLGLARICYEWNDLEAAEQHGQESLRLARQVESTDRFIVCEVFLARLKLAQGDTSGAAALLAEAAQSARQQNFVSRLPEVVAAQVLVLLKQGQWAAASQLAETYDLPLSRARVHLAGAEPAAALAVLQPLRQQVEASDWKDEQLKVRILQAMALQARGDQDQAVQVLGYALALAQSAGCIRTFVDEGQSMAHLLAQAAARGMLPEYIKKLQAAFREEQQTRDDFSSLPPSPAQPLIEPLSGREVEILRLIAQGLSNDQISERLFLALSTVKGHNRNIFGKLQVQRRTEAVARARELGLL